MRTRWVAIALILAAPSSYAAGSAAGQAIFRGACAGCHAAGSPRVLAGQSLLADAGAIRASDPDIAIDFILHGRQPPAEQRGAWMPPFETILSDTQIADVLAWLRQSAGGPAWPDLAQHVRALRTETQR
jgi:mono/diheme cytochrome c family protein